MTLDEFIRLCEDNGYERWSISRTQERGERGEPLESYNVSLDGVFSISATEHTLEDVLLTLLSVIDALHGTTDLNRIRGAADRPPHRLRRDLPRGGVS
jgi:hypothetical protein